MRRLLAFLVLVGLAGPATACINDREQPDHEREFRSQYITSGQRPITPAVPRDSRLVVGVGGALLAGALIVTIRGPQGARPWDGLS